MLKLRDRKRRINDTLLSFGLHKNASHLQKLVTVFGLECENLRTWEYYDSNEVNEIIESGKPILKNKNMSSRRSAKKNENSNTSHFVDGIVVFDPHENAPDFCVAVIKLNRDKLIEWLDKEDNDKFFADDEKYGDTLTLNLNESKDGKLYASINTYGTDAVESKEEKKEEKTSRRRGK